MTRRLVSQDAIISVGVKTVLLVLIVFVGGLVSGIVLFQSLDQVGNSPLSEEALDLISGHVWVRNAWTEAGIVMVNSGQRDATFQRIAVNGIESSWSRVYY
jgi:hypothetical protein